MNIKAAFRNGYPCTVRNAGGRFGAVVVGLFDYPATVYESWAALGAGGNWLWLEDAPWGRQAALHGRVWPVGVQRFGCANGARMAFLSVTQHGWAGNGFAVVDY